MTGHWLRRVFRQMVFTFTLNRQEGNDNVCCCASNGDAYSQGAKGLFLSGQTCCSPDTGQQESVVTGSE